MNWHSLVIIGIIVVLFIILMIINASASDLDQEEKTEDELNAEGTISEASAPATSAQNTTNTNG